MKQVKEAHIDLYGDKKFFAKGFLSFDRIINFITFVLKLFTILFFLPVILVYKFYNIKFVKHSFKFLFLILYTVIVSTFIFIIVNGNYLKENKNLQNKIVMDIEYKTKIKSF